MPFPEPDNDDSEEEFIEKCMSAPTMEGEFPNDDQRLAVCQSIWNQQKEQGG